MLASVANTCSTAASPGLAESALAWRYPCQQPPELCRAACRSRCRGMRAGSPGEGGLARTWTGTAPLPDAVPASARHASPLGARRRRWRACRTRCWRASWRAAGWCCRMWAPRRCAACAARPPGRTCTSRPPPTASATRLQVRAPAAALRSPQPLCAAQLLVSPPHPSRISMCRIDSQPRDRQARLS